MNKKSGTNYFKLVLRSLWTSRKFFQAIWYTPHLLLGASMTVMLVTSFASESPLIKQSFLWGGFFLLFTTTLVVVAIIYHTRRIENAFAIVHSGDENFTKPKWFIRDMKNPFSMDTIYVTSGGHSVEDFKNKIGHVSMRLGKIIESVSLADIKNNIIRVDIQKGILPNHVRYAELDFTKIKPSEFVVGYSNNGIELLDYSRMYHMLVAGQTGSGKTVFLKQFMMTALVHCPQSYVCLIDMKGGIDYQAFDGCSNFNCVTESKDAAITLKAILSIFEKRKAYLKSKKLEQWSELSVRELDKENAFQGETIGRIFVVVDELAELTKSVRPDSKDCTEYLSEIARLARCVGIHLVMGTQRPDKSVINMQIKDTVPTRICFSVPSVSASTLVVGNMLASTLGNHAGRAAYSFNGIKTLQAPFVKNDDIARDTKLLRLAAQDNSQPRTILKAIQAIQQKEDKECPNVRK